MDLVCEACRESWQIKQNYSWLRRGRKLQRQSRVTKWTICSMLTARNELTNQLGRFSSVLKREEQIKIVNKTCVESFAFILEPGVEAEEPAKMPHTVLRGQKALPSQLRLQTSLP